MEKVFLVLNPTSGRGGGRRAVETIRRALYHAGIPFDLHETTQAGEAIEIVRQARQTGYRTVVAAGGDGTVNEIVNGLARAARPGEPVGRLGILPVGTGNDFASMVGAPRRLAAAAEAIRQGRIRRIDLGHVQIRTEDTTLSRYFGNNLGIGFEAQATVESRRITRLRGFVVYLLAVLKALRSYQHPHFQVHWSDPDGQTHFVERRALMVSIGNSRRTGGGFYITPDAEVDDGVLDLAIANSMGRAQILALLPLILFGAHRNHPAVYLTRCGAVSILSDLPVPVHADGEVLTEQARAFAVTLEPRRLEVIV